jgi:F-type H+-transporting ATPase subunit gamma
MPSLIDIRRRIRSVKNTQQITRAMKMVSAAKLRRAQDRVVASRPYAGLLRTVLGNVAAAVQGDEKVGKHPLLAQRPEQKILLVLMTADKGLAGAFNTNLIKGAQKFAADHPDAALQFVLVGRKGADFFRKRGASTISEHIGIAAKPSYAETSAIAQRAITLFCEEQIDAVYVIYNEFRSVVSQKLTINRVLPVEMPDQSGGDYLFEQPPAEMLNDLLPRYVEIEFYRSLLETAASEHAARMTAMEAATSNASDMIDRLTLYMNRVRQASITKEIIEVVSGAAAAE